MNAIHLHLLVAEKAHLLERVAAEVFDCPIDAALVAAFIADPRHHLLLAELDGEVVGMISAINYIHPDKPDELWINEVGVGVDFRQRGIGRLLMEGMLAHGRALGCGDAWLGTEVSNIAARRLYAAVGGREEPMVYVTFELPPQPEPDWEIWRQDDNGRRYLVSRGHKRSEAQRLCDAYASHGHKQFYWIAPAGKQA